MKDNYISRAAVIAEGFWAAAVLMVIATWVLAPHLAHHWQFATGITAILAMAGAVTCQIRLYVLRLCGLIRISAGLESPDAELSHIGPRR